PARDPAPRPASGHRAGAAEPRPAEPRSAEIPLLPLRFGVDPRYGPLSTRPPFITKGTSSSSAMSSVGSPGTATRSANEPGTIEPTRSHPRRSAAATVALRIASIGVIPYRTMYANCLPTQRWG